jgi:diketogulonate reductase-like aldo/keto reductase
MDDIVTSRAGVHSPKIIYGTAWKKSATERLVRTALEQGFRGIDTACQPKHYDEAGVGAGVAACLNARLTRADLYLQTKFTPLTGQDPMRVPYDPKAPLTAQVAQSFAASLRNLQTDYLDCLILHSPLRNPEQTMEVWRAIESLVDRGAVRQPGISNCYEIEQLATLYDSARIKPAIVQNRFHAETGYDFEIRAFCNKNRIVYQSFWTLTANPHILAHAAITSLALKYGRTPEQTLFRYLTQSAVVPLTGTRSETHMREDLAIFEFELTDHERAALDVAFPSSIA